MQYLRRIVACLAVLGLIALGGTGARASSSFAYLNTLAPSPPISVSTIPANGDQNPYGVAVVPNGFPTNGPLRPGDILVSNFNNAGNLQGTGTTIVVVSPSGAVGTFFTAPASLTPVGLTTALSALRSGLVIVGNTPTTDGTSATISNGSLIVLDQHGSVQLNLKSATLLQGPWDMTADDSIPTSPILYVSNVLSGTVTRINLHVRIVNGEPVPAVVTMTQIASGFLHRFDPAALVVGPTGLLLGRDHQTLYVADTGNNRVQVLGNVSQTRSDLGAGRTVVAGAPLKGPLALAWSPFQTIVASNGDAVGDPSTPPNMVVEFNAFLHRFVAKRQLDTSGTPGGIFGIAIAPVNQRTSLIFVDDNSVTLNVLPPRY